MKIRKAFGLVLWPLLLIITFPFGIWVGFIAFLFVVVMPIFWVTGMDEEFEWQPWLVAVAVVVIIGVPSIWITFLMEAR